MTLQRLSAKVNELAADQVGAEPYSPLGLANLAVFRQAEPTTFEGLIYEPVVCLVLQGEKHATIADRSITYGAGETVIVSHEVPVVARITQASPQKPYLALILRLDLAVIRELADQLGNFETGGQQPRAIAVSKADDDLVEALYRYVSLAGKAVEREVMAPLILKEIHFRLLVAPNGGMLRRLLHRDSQASRIARAIDHIRRHFKTPLTVAELAQVAGMSASSFHEHFKAIAETSPLQYQKDLRLLEAKRLLAAGSHSVSTAAFDVGYESATQFSREYTRKFGTSPRHDLGRGDPDRRILAAIN